MLLRPAVGPRPMKLVDRRPTPERRCAGAETWRRKHISVSQMLPHNKQDPARVKCKPIKKNSSSKQQQAAFYLPPRRIQTNTDQKPTNSITSRAQRRRWLEECLSQHHHKKTRRKQLDRCIFNTKLLLLLLTVSTLIMSGWLMRTTSGQPGSSGGSTGRMVRLCIASVEPSKLSSQCVMCNRREFPLTVIDCTGITKVNDLIANPLSVQEAACLIYNCRRQVPDIKPEPYHGAISHAARVHSSAAAARYHPSASGSGMMQSYETIMPSPLSSPSSLASSSMLSPPTASLATMFGGLPAPPLPFSSTNYYSMQQPSMASYYATNSFQQQQQQPASSVPYSMRYGPFAASNGGGYNNVGGSGSGGGIPMQFVQQSSSAGLPFYGPMAAMMAASQALPTNRGFSLSGSRGAASMPSNVIWPQSFGGGATGANYMYDAGSTQLHPSTTAMSSQHPFAAFMGQSAPAIQFQQPYTTMMMSPTATSTTEVEAS